MIYFSGVRILPKGSHTSGGPINRNTSPANLSGEKLNCYWMKTPMAKVHDGNHKTKKRPLSNDLGFG